MITNIHLDHAGGSSWRLTWDSASPGPFSVYRDGAILGASTDKVRYVDIPYGSRPVFWVGEPGEFPPQHFPDHIVLGWYHQSGSDGYRVEKYVGSAWELQATVPVDGHWFYTWRSPTLADDTEHQFRIVTARGDVVSAGVEATVLMVRVPDAVARTIAYNPVNRKPTITVTV